MHGDPDWALTDEQFQYFKLYQQMIEDAFKEDNMEGLRAFAEGESFLAKFGDMGFDEAYDRFQDIVDPQ
jgi:hypothetical protein